MGFFITLIIMFAFNIFCGMRADGITMKRCRNFSMKKFGNSLIELFLYLLIIQVLFTAMHNMGDGSEALILIKTISYVFCYVYFQNGLKNLINAYPPNRGFRIIYHIIRFEFKKIVPGYMNDIMSKVNEEMKNKEEENYDNKQIL